MEKQKEIYTVQVDYAKPTGTDRQSKEFTIKAEAENYYNRMIELMRENENKLTEIYKDKNATFILIVTLLHKENSTITAISAEALGLRGITPTNNPTETIFKTKGKHNKQ